MHARPFGPDACFLNLMPDYLKDVTLDGLALLAAQAYARREVFLLESEHIAAKPIPVEVHVRAIHQRIVNRKRLRFSELVDERTPLPVVVVTFLAVLELYKRAMVKIEQQGRSATSTSATSRARASFRRGGRPHSAGTQSALQARLGQGKRTAWKGCGDARGGPAPRRRPPCGKEG